MTITSFENLTGRVINGLRIESIARRQPEVAWHAECTKCGTRQTVRHFLLTQNAAQCGNAGCGRRLQRETRGSAIAIKEGGRTASNVERREFEQSQQPRQPITDPESEQRRAKRIEAERRQLDRLREPYKRYYWHQLERGGQPMTLQRFWEIGEFAQKHIMEIVVRDENGESEK